MTENSRHKYRPVSAGDPPPTLDEIFDCLRLTRRHDPRSFRTSVCRHLLVGGERTTEEVTIQVVPTNLRVVLEDEAESPEYELEGWLLTGEPDRIWVRGRLSPADDYNVDELELYLLEPGEELGTGWSVQIDTTYPQLHDH